MNSLSFRAKPDIINLAVLVFAVLMLCGMQTVNANQLALANSPLFLSNTATPLVMLNISKDHQLYFKAYDDYSDLDGISGLETTYKNSFDYYGYFDSYKCYTYSSANNRFEPSSSTSTKYCTAGSHLWSGNFLNWASMTRIDVIRKILYGGLRTTDTGSTIVNTTTSSSATVSSYTGSPRLISTTANGTTESRTNPVPGLIDSTTRLWQTSSAVVAQIPAVADVQSDPSTTVNGNVSTTVSTLTSKVDTQVTNIYLGNDVVKGTCSFNHDKTCYTYSTTTKVYRTATSIVTTTTTATTTSLSNAVTVLERSYLPNDAHSFAKYYNGSDLTKLADVGSSVTELTLCNTTTSSTTLSQNVTDPPLLRVKPGNYMLWAANERWQCRWSDEVAASNGNVSASSGLSANASSPSKGTDGIDLVVRVKVCDSSLIGTESCKIYTNGNTGANKGLLSYKPTGLLQTYGDANLLKFGLLTGSYTKNKSGGVLRKNISAMTDEINQNDGTFNAAPSTGGIVNTLNKLRIKGYRHDDGTYFNVTGSDGCSWGLASFSDGSCSNWGNPVSEIYLESLRYLSNHSASSTFNTDDSGYISGLITATTVNPVTSAQWCAKMSVIEFNASSSSYDGDQLSGASDIGLSTLNTATDSIGTGESITNNSFFVGSTNASATDTTNDQLCTAKTIANLSSVNGICPDSPRLSGTYQIAGLAGYAHNNDLVSSITGNQTVNTFGVALAPALPKIIVPVPTTTGIGTSGKFVNILPACRDLWNSGDTTKPGNCALVDFKIVNETSSDCSFVSSPAIGAKCGKVYINWEDSEQGGDYDMDMWGVLTYMVSSTSVKITTQVIYQSTPYRMGFGYVLGGTQKDGFHAHSGINSYSYTDSAAGTGTSTHCSSCVSTDAATSVTYNVGTSTASSLQQPLFYASKWGAFTDFNNNGRPDLSTEWDTDNNGIPDEYFYATNPAALATSLAHAFNSVISKTASAAAAAANSTSVQTGTSVYQAQFNSTDWSGHLYSFNVLTSGAVDTAHSNWEAASLLPAAADRNIVTYNPDTRTGVNFTWASPQVLSTSQQTALNTNAYGVLDGLGADRLNWLRGDSSKEAQNSAGIFRNRIPYVLGDIINSDPVFTKSEDYGYSGLPTTAAEQRLYAAYLTGKSSRIPMLYVGGNDGMLHAFGADTPVDNTGNHYSGHEVFAYVPAAIYGKLSSLTDPNYTHKYLVDGSPTVSDAYLNSNWTTVLVSGLGAGGKAIIALDISSPTTFSSQKVLWEYSGATTDTGNTGTRDIDGLGLTTSQPQIARMNDGSWVAIFGNGYNSSSEKAYLYIVNLTTGALIKKIATNNSTSNGLSTAVLYDGNNDKIIDYAYAGDLQGNLWKFDLSSSSSADWGLGNAGLPLFTAINSDNKIQPITSRPTVGGNPQGGVMVYFGTGSYLTSADVANTDTQSFYAVWDNTSFYDTTALRANLVHQSISIAATAGTTNSPANCPNNAQSCSSTVNYDLRKVTSLPVDSTKRGWYIDLDTGERVLSPGFLQLGQIFFLTTIPSTDPCVPGGTSWLMTVDMLSGGASASPIFDLNNDNAFNNADTVGSSNYMVAGVKSNVGMIKNIVWLANQATQTTAGHSTLIGSGTTTGWMNLTAPCVGTCCSSGNCNNTNNPQPSTVTRRSWQQIQ